ncbi:glucose 6-phosphate dehydrogenase [Deinococcus psychrotolerans]|uniref:Glucose 6-phosphate dehydrogenase n=1 Tax=Deinococcus psychrotolerans TaxID=2489213 RepID=A0A3G8YAN2_9DEIO|nr:glucose-6-phosphate dehydrogenase assembly protein OpcA [Deinococcus psychrotolerans]AZI42412.1 glucose 6-phosphate dehydrogenase [Deinococcus psychrotolerans]
MTARLSLAPLGPLPTNVRGAQRTLDELWAQTDIETRAYTGNIIALTTPNYQGRVQEALTGLEGRYAGRQIIAVMEPAASGRMSIDAQLVPQQGLYIERLTLLANPGQLRGAILPLLRPATVNHVWWASDDPPGGPLLRELTDVADQVIADSLRLDIPPARNYALADLGWSRSAAWREGLAQLFDSRDAAGMLGHVNRLKIWSGGRNDRAARLFASWVATTLGWKDLSPVTFVRGDCQRQHGDLCGVELAGKGVSFLLKSIGPELVQSSVKFDKVNRKTTLMVPSMTLAEGLARVMARPERGSEFEAAWKLARASMDEAAPAQAGSL